MARRVFFSFHFQRDSWRVSQVRNCWTVRADHEATPFLDAADWEKIQREGDAAIQRWINGQLSGTSVTCVLIGAETASRPWVRYEIEQSFNKGNGLLGIRIHNIKDRNQRPDIQGANPFDAFTLTQANGVKVPLSQSVRVYDWVINDGRNNISSWIEAAAKARGR
jgi:MTH538 TIR-like domain (DUF1863)